MRNDKQKLFEGATVYVQGHEMKVTNFRTYFDDKGVEVARFEGICLDKNDSLIGTGYDGGTYGGNRLAYDF